jgi:hypothetical protein
VLPSPSGVLSLLIPSSNTESANKQVEKELIRIVQSKRGPYAVFSPKVKARIANYAVMHGTTSALKHFVKEFPDLKRTTINDWKVAVIELKKKDHSEGMEESVLELNSKKRGRPTTLTPEI